VRRHVKPLSILAADDNEQELFCLKAETQAPSKSSGYTIATYTAILILLNC
jgi:hypothetical protein